MQDFWNKDEQLLRFILACDKQNIGYLALLVCITGDIDAQESLHTFCGIKWKPHRYTPRKGTVPLDIVKLRDVLCEKKMTQTKISQIMGLKRVYLAQIFYEAKANGYINKNKKFVEKMEKVLNLPKGTLIKKGD